MADSVQGSAAVKAPWFAVGPKMCDYGDLKDGEECLRVAQYEWRWSDEADPLFLCNYHADPLIQPGANDA